MGQVLPFLNKFGLWNYGYACDLKLLTVHPQLESNRGPDGIKPFNNDLT